MRVSRADERPAQILVTIEHREPILDQETLVTYENGEEQRLAFRYETGSDTINHLGDAVARTRAQWQDTELVIHSWLEAAGRELHLKDYWSISEDGKVLTMEHRDDSLAGQIVMYERREEK